MLKPWVRIALLLFCVGWGANHFVALLLVYKATLALDVAAPAALLGMYALGLVPGLLLSGPLSDRYGRPAIVFPATGLTLVASALLGAGGGSFDALLLGRLLYGVGAGAAMNPGAVWLLELSDGAAPGAGARRATLALSAGFGFGPLLSGLLAQYAPHPTLLPYVVHLIVSAVAIGLALRAPVPPRAATRPGPLLRIGLDRSNRGPFLHGVVWMAPFVFGFPAIAFATLPVLAGGNLRPSTVGALAGLTLAAGMLAQPFTRRTAPTTAARAGLVVGAAGVALGAGAVAWHTNLLLLGAAALLGGAYGACMTSGLRTIETLSRPDTRTGLVGLYYVLTYVGFAAPVGLALAVRKLTPTAALFAVAGLALVAAAALRAPPIARPFSRFDRPTVVADLIGRMVSRRFSVWQKVVALAPLLLLAVYLPGQMMLRCRIDGSLRRACCCQQEQEAQQVGPVLKAQDCCDREMSANDRPVVEPAQRSSLDVTWAVSAPLPAAPVSTVLAESTRSERAWRAHGPPADGPPLVLLKHAFLI